MKKNHVIGEMDLNVSTNEEDGAMALGDSISEFFIKNTLPELSAKFDEICPEDLVIEIDELEISIESKSDGDLKREINDKIKEKLVKALEEKVASGANRKHDQSVVVKDESGEEVELKPSKKVELKKEELLLFYLQTGVVPYWAPSMKDISFKEELVNEIEGNPELLVSFLNVKPSFSSLIRAFVLFNDIKGIKKLKSLFDTNGNFEKIDKFINQISKNSSFSHTQLNQFKLEVFALNWSNDKGHDFVLSSSVFSSLVDEVLKNSVRKGQTEFGFSKNTIVALSNDFISRTKPNFQLEEEIIVYTSNSGLSIEEAFLKVFAPLKKLTDLIPKGKKLFADFIEDSIQKRAIISQPINEDLIKKYHKLATTSEVKAKDYFKNEIEAKDKGEKKVLKKEVKESDTKRVKEVEDLISEGIYISNAGLCLFSPYYTHFLKNMEVLKDGELIDANRAVLLLQFLVTGETDFEEYDLSFNKLICGIPLTDPISTKLEISEDEIEECEALLSAVIANWKSLQGSSVGGLRESFMQREAQLHFKDPNWGLQVERTGLDVLVDSIEWGYSMIKMPWNEYIIYVEW